MADSRRKLALVLMCTFHVVQHLVRVMKIPFLFLVSRALLSLVAVGGLLRLLMNDSHSVVGENPLKEVLSLETAEKLTRLAYQRASRLALEVKEIVLWTDPQKSLYVLLGLYVMGIFFRLVPFTVVLYLAVWAAFLHVYFHDFAEKHVWKHVEPYAARALDFLIKLHDRIPRLNEDKLL